MLKTLKYFGGLEPHEQSFLDFENYPEQCFVPWTDEQAYEAYPEFRWIYDKLYVCNLLNQDKSIYLGDFCVPDVYPVFVKPRKNLEGLGVNAQKVRTAIGIQSFTGEDYIAQPYKTGEQTSTDFIINEGRLVYHSRTFKAVKKSGTITEWHSKKFTSSHAWAAAHKLLHKLKGYNGVINIEMIGDFVIECHLRPSTCFTPFQREIIDAHYNLQLGEKLINLSKTYKEGYVIVNRVRKDMKMPKFLPFVDNEKYPGVLDVKYVGTPGKHLSTEPQDLYSFKFFDVYSEDLNNGRAYSEQLRDAIEKFIKREFNWV